MRLADLQGDGIPCSADRRASRRRRLRHADVTERRLHTKVIEMLVRTARAQGRSEPRELVIIEARDRRDGSLTALARDQEEGRRHHQPCTPSNPRIEMEVPSRRERDGRNRPASQRFVTWTLWSISVRPGSSRSTAASRTAGGADCVRWPHPAPAVEAGACYRAMSGPVVPGLVPVEQARRSGVGQKLDAVERGADKWSWEQRDRPSHARRSRARLATLSPEKLEPRPG